MTELSVKDIATLLAGPLAEVRLVMLYQSQQARLEAAPDLMRKSLPTAA
jgi:hypothetical protein